MELVLVTLVVLYFLAVRVAMLSLFFRGKKELTSYKPVVTYPTAKPMERPKELEEVLKKIQETTAGPPLVGEEVDMGVY